MHRTGAARIVATWAGIAGEDSADDACEVIYDAPVGAVVTVRVERPADVWLPPSIAEAREIDRHRVRVERARASHDARSAAHQRRRSGERTTKPPKTTTTPAPQLPPRASLRDRMRAKQTKGATRDE